MNFDSARRQAAEIEALQALQDASEGAASTLPSF